MTYTNTWSTTTPAGTDSASNSATDMTKIRVDLQERMETLLGVGNWSTDPIVVVQSLYKQFMHWSQFQAFSGAASYTTGSGLKYGLQPGSATASTLYAAVMLPRGATVTELALMGYDTGSGTITCTLESINATTATVTQTTHGTVTIVGPQSQTRATTTLSPSLTIDSTAANYIYYYIKITIPANTTHAWQGVELTYTRPNLSVAV